MAAALAAAALAATAAAQTPPEPAPSASPPPSSSARPSPPAAEAPSGVRNQEVEITSGRPRDADERRQSTAAKIVIGREDIERMGDSSTSEVLKRLPGVTIGGAPGRGGAPRMRGLGAGFTQIMLNGERLPPGFTVDSITPEQIDRIEILRAPTAETGARAIAGTINIVLREGFRRRLNEVRAGLEVNNGRVSPNVFWTRNDSVGESFVYTGSLGVTTAHAPTTSHAASRTVDLTTRDVIEQYDDETYSVPRNQRLHANARLQWRLGEGHSLVLMPIGVVSENDWNGGTDRVTSVGAPRFAWSRSENDGRFTMGRLNAQYNRIVFGGSRFDLRAGAGVNRWRGFTTTRQYDEAGALLRTIENDTTWRDANQTLNAKFATTVADGHNLVTGVEVEQGERRETRITLENGVTPAVLDDFGENLKASTQRLAAFVQDEWNWTPQWAFHAGVRWEAIETEGDGPNGTTLRNKSSVTTPLLHAVYKIDPRRREQIRASLTQSYRTPTLAQLIARPLVSTTNSLASPDRYGNPALKPELANGLDLAYERYLDEGGVLSANLFHRRIRDVIRSVIEVNDTTGRAESRPQNIGAARTTGLELEARFRLAQAVEGAPNVDVRFNTSLFRSRVEGVPGPDNRIEGQPNATANLGADYRFRGTPLTLGGNLNWTPSITTRLSDAQVRRESGKLVGDVYALWTFDPNLQLRLSANNVAPRDYEASNRIEGGGLQQTSVNTDRPTTNWQLRLEVKL